MVRLMREGGLDDWLRSGDICGAVVVEASCLSSAALLLLLLRLKPQQQSSPLATTHASAPAETPEAVAMATSCDAPLSSTGDTVAGLDDGESESEGVSEGDSEGDSGGGGEGGGGEGARSGRTAKVGAITLSIVTPTASDRAEELLARALREATTPVALSVTLTLAETLTLAAARVRVTAAGGTPR